MGQLSVLERSLQTPGNYFLWIAIFVYLIWQISFLWKRRNLYIKSWNVPGMVGLPFLGSSYLSIFCRTSSELHEKLVEIGNKFRSTFKVWFGTKLVYILLTPEHVKKVLMNPNCSVKDEFFYGVANSFLGPGLLTAPVAVWKRHRKAISPSFNKKVLESFMDDFVKGGAQFAEAFDENVDNELDIFAIASRCNLTLLLQTIMGVGKISKIQVAEYGNMLNRFMELGFMKTVSIVNRIEFIWNILYGKEVERLTSRFVGFVNKIIEEKLEQKSKGESPRVTQLENERTRKAFLDWILETTTFTRQEIRDEVNIFMFAAMDTSASALSFIFTVLGIYPEIQEKVYDEVLGVLGPERIPQAEDLPHLKYSENVIKETLRYFPVGPFFMRSITDDVDLGDTVLPAGSSVLIMSLPLHRHPDIWEDPLKFDPDRFSPENVGRIPPGAYVPFSLGPRNCIGMNYAMMNMKTTLAMLVRKFKFRSEHKSAAEVEISTSLTLKYKGNSRLYVERREPTNAK